MASTLLEWMDQHHPEITTELLMGVVDKDAERTAASSDPEEAEKWVKRHHRSAFEEWRQESAGSGTKKHRWLRR